MDQFQSTRPQGARQDVDPNILRITNVSIHAPAGGATLKQHSAVIAKLGFNPRARRGRDG